MPLIFLIGLALAFAFHLFFFYPSTTQLTGWGDDPAFNLYTFESIWRNLRLYGLGKIFSKDFWTLSIFHPSSLGLALSENQLIPGLFTFPLLSLGKGGIYALQLWGIFLGLCSFIFAYLWLRHLKSLEESLKSLGYGEMAQSSLCVFGALLFSCCGWIQSHVAHFQNICIFLFPLALWLWSRFKAKPSPTSAIISGFFFGWAAGWNLYFQVLLNLILVTFLFLFLKELRRPWHKSRTAILGVLLLITTIGMELPFVAKYKELESFIGSLGLSKEGFRLYSSDWSSFLKHANFQSLPQKILSFYPKIPGEIERVNYMGFLWPLLFLIFFFMKRTRKLWIYGGLALFFQFVSMGPDAIIYNIFHLFPGASAMRAVGRIQIGFVLFSIPLLLSGLSWIYQKSRWSILLFLLIIFEILPGARPLRKDFDFKPYGSRINPLVMLGQNLGHNFSQDFKENILVLPSTNGPMDLYTFQAGLRSLGGYSGRSTMAASFIDALIRNPKRSDDFWTTLLISVPVNFILSSDPALSTELKNIAYQGGLLRKESSCLMGAESHELCLFEVNPAFKTQSKSLLITQEAMSWKEAVGDPEYYVSELRAIRAGVLDYQELATCRVESFLTYKSLHFSWHFFSKLHPFPIHAIQKINITEAEKIIEVKRRWPKFLRRYFPDLQAAWKLVCK